MNRNDGPGVAYAFQRIRGLVRGWADVEAHPATARFDRDVAVPMRDGVVLRVNVFRPMGTAPVPVIMSAHPYGKDVLPKKTWLGYRAPFQCHLMRQPGRARFSAWTSWEAPDPGFWVRLGYAVVNADMRGFHHSEGEGSILTHAQGRDYFDLIEWAAAQPWSTGKVGLCGVSYLAISQWFAAAERPPHLAAICPWEGFSDPYRDLMYPGGIRERGFIPFWARNLRKQTRNRDDIERDGYARPLLGDPWWTERTPELERVDVPALICASFSDHNLHTRGSFEGFRRIASQDKWIYTHRGGKWVSYYSDEALALQRRFFDCFLKGIDNGMHGVAPVRLEVRASRGVIHEVRAEQEWPLARTCWTPLFLHDGGVLARQPCAAAAEVSYACVGGKASFSWTVPHATEITGPMKLRLHVEARAADDLLIFAGVRMFREGREIVFEGSYGFGHDLVARGWLRVSHRRCDVDAGEPWRPVLTHDREEKLAPGEIAAVEVEILPSATRFRRGDELRLDLQGRYFYKKNPLLGQFPAAYEASERGECVLHFGGEYDAHLLVPFVDIPQG